MQSLIKALTETYGPSGREGTIRDVIQEKVKKYADAMKVDYLGNLIVEKRGTGQGKKIMLAAHMDEIALMVTHIDEKGFLRFTNVGGHSPHVLTGIRVQFSQGHKGVVFHEPLKSKKDMSLETMYIDIGASSKEEAEAMVELGDMAAFCEPMDMLGEKRVVAKSLDDRIGCVILAEALKELDQTPHDLYFVFTTQEEVGLRGARTSAYGIDPDFALAVDVTMVGDTPEAKKMAVSLGQGTAIKIRDSSMLTPPRVKDFLIERAKENNISYQLEVLERGGTDAGAIHLAREGVPSGCLSIPCRYIHSPSEVVDLHDVQATVDLLLAVLKKDIPF